MVLEWSITSLGGVWRLGQKPRLGTVYHGLRTVLETCRETWPCKGLSRCMETET